MGRKASNLHLVVNGSDLTIGNFGLDQLVQQAGGLVEGWRALFSVDGHASGPAKVSR